MENNTRMTEEYDVVSSYSVLDLMIVKRMAIRYSKVADFYMYGLDNNGEIFCEMTGEKKENKKLLELIGEDCLEAMAARVSSDGIEVQATEDTAYRNLKIAGVSVYAGRVPVITWIMIGVLSDDDAEEFAPIADTSDFSRITTLSQFYDSIDIVRDASQLIVSSKVSLEAALAESRRSKYSEEEIKQSLKRTEAISEVVSLLESDAAIEIIMNEMIKTVGSYLDVSAAFIARAKRGMEDCDITAEWYNSGVVSLFERQRGQRRFHFLYTEKPLVISADTDADYEDREAMNAIDATALCVIPIQMGNGTAMYTCFFDRTLGRKWKTNEIKFIYDSIKVLQSILTKRIQRNSLASSYASLEAILDNVGSAIYVRDIQTGAVLFANKVLKNTFAKEFQSGSLDELFDSAIPSGRGSGVYEVHHEDKGHWYELHYTFIDWVDGRKVSLCAAYDVTDKKGYQRRVEQQSYTDFLTGLYNRMCCERDLAKYVDSAKNSGTHGALLYLDLDDFKHINDGLGHQYGDVLLKAISHSLQRVEGIKNTCYRVGGDEFIIIIPPESYPDFSNILTNINRIFEKPWYLKDADYYCTMSMGVVEFPGCGENVSELIKRADIALFEAKRGGKNRIAQYSDNMDSTSTARLDMEKNMRDAMAKDYEEFEVYYQPIVDIMEGNKCVGAEALIRWNSSSMGFVGPGDFIPLAEYLGLINPIGNHVLLEACKTCKEWNDNGYPNYKVNVNLSVVQLLHPEIVKIVADTIAETGINPKNLTLEVTESLAINDMGRMKKILANIKALGVKIALDDFGTGYSSLNHIREIPFDVIKVDQSFVQDLAEDTYSQSFIKMVAELAETIGVNICVEGIETDRQFKVLGDMKVRMVQGFYFDRPMPKSAFMEKYIR